MYTELTISQADRRPMYLQIMEQIRHRIAVGDWQPGQEIPSIRALAVAAQVSVITVKRAYLELEREGVIVSRQGRGSFVADNVELSTRLREQELNEHLGAAAHIGRQLGLGADALEARLRRIVERDEAERRGRDVEGAGEHGGVEEARGDDGGVDDGESESESKQ